MHSMAGSEQSECEASSSKPRPPPAVINVKGTKYSVGELRWSLRAGSCTRLGASAVRCGVLSPASVCCGRVTGNGSHRGQQCRLVSRWGRG